MKTMAWAVMVVVGIMFVASSGFAADKKYSGFLGDSYSLLAPGPKDGAKERYVKPGIDFTMYKKLMIDSVIFYFADDSEYKGIDPNEMKELSDQFNQAILNAVMDKYPVVADPGPDVLRLKVAITNIKASKPGVSAVTSILPIGIVLSGVKKGASGSWSGSGATAAELMALDSTTNDILALAVDERSAGFGERFSKWGSAKEAFDFWAKRIRAFLDGDLKTESKSEQKK